MNQKLCCVFFAILSTVFSGSAVAQSDTAFTYQGELQENGGPANGSFNLDVSLWDAVAAGNQIGATIMLDGVPVVAGRFMIDLDFGAAAFDNSSRWLEIEVSGVTLVPRQPFTRAPYAINSIQTRGIFVDPANNVGIGTTTPAGELQVANSNAGDSAEIGISADDAQGALAVYSSTFVFPHLADRVSLFSDAFDSSGLDVRADGASSDIRFYSGGFGPSSERMRITDTGNVGIGTTSPETQLHLSGNSPVMQKITSASAAGTWIEFENTSTGGKRWGIISTGAANGEGAGKMLFRAISDGHTAMTLQGDGNVGVGTSAPEAKLHSVTDSASEPAIIGQNPASTGTGVRGRHLSQTGQGFGVLGSTTSSSGYGVFSSGDLGAAGTKSFIQPHPYDASKQIRFVCLEGNEAGTYFRGNAQLENGRAYIEVPEEFRLVTEAEGMTVQITPRGPDAGLWVRSSDLELIVVMGRDNVEFDYFVNGIRRGHANHISIEQNSAYVPTESAKPFGTQYPEEIRQILVDNGILKPDLTPNEQTAAALGWDLISEPEDESKQRSMGITK